MGRKASISLESCSGQRCHVHFWIPAPGTLWEKPRWLIQSIFCIQRTRPNTSSLVLPPAGATRLPAPVPHCLCSVRPAASRRWCQSHKHGPITAAVMTGCAVHTHLSGRVVAWHPVCVWEIGASLLSDPRRCCHAFSRRRCAGSLTMQCRSLTLSLRLFRLWPLGALLALASLFCYIVTLFCLVSGPLYFFCRPVKEAL